LFVNLFIGISNKVHKIFEYYSIGISISGPGKGNFSNAYYISGAHSYINFYMSGIVFV